MRFFRHSSREADKRNRAVRRLDHQARIGERAQERHDIAVGALRRVLRAVLFEAFLPIVPGGFQQR